MCSSWFHIQGLFEICCSGVSEDIHFSRLLFYYFALPRQPCTFWVGLRALLCSYAIRTWSNCVDLYRRIRVPIMIRYPCCHHVFMCFVSSPLPSTHSHSLLYSLHPCHSPVHVFIHPHYVLLLSEVGHQPWPTLLLQYTYSACQIFKDNQICSVLIGGGG